jgi:nitrogen fixation protein NifU and related proteins
MADLRELYQEVVFDHYKKPRNCHRLTDANRSAEGYNPLCGDKVTVYLKIDAGVIADVSFEGLGCAISTASASLMTEALKGKTLEEAEHMFKEFHEMVTCHDHAEYGELGKLEVLAGVSEFPARVKCATLAWHTLQQAIKNRGEVVTTE